MNPIDFGCQRSKVKVTIEMHGNKLVNTVETKPLCASSSNLADMLTMVRGWSLLTGPSLGLILGRHSAPFPTPNSIFFSQIDSSKFPTEHSQICWPKLVQSNDIYSSNSVLLSFINVQIHVALVNTVFKGYYHWSVLWMRVVYLHKTTLPLKCHSNADYYWLRNRK